MAKKKYTVSQLSAYAKALDAIADELDSVCMDCSVDDENGDEMGISDLVDAVLDLPWVGRTYPTFQNPISLAEDYRNVADNIREDLLKSVLKTKGTKDWEKAKENYETFVGPLPASKKAKKVTKR